jgi:hypothetical protein
MQTIVNDVLRMDTSIQAVFYFWAFCVVAFYGTLTYGLVKVLINSLTKNKKAMA